MPTLEIQCTAGFSDNFATSDNKTRLNILLENCTGRLSVENKPDTPRSEHIFTIDAVALGYDGTYNLTEEEARKLFLIACSLIHPRFFFSSIQPNTLKSTLIQDQPKTSAEISEDKKTGKTTIHFTEVIRIKESVETCLISNLTIDCDSLFQIIEKLLKFKIFSTYKRSKTELNIVEAIKSYGEAFTSTDISACYKSMYAALEKAINSDMERNGDTFDIEVARLTGMNQTEIKTLREFYNRLKHPLKNLLTHLHTLRKGEETVGVLLRDLKKATDIVLLSKIS